MGMSLIKKLDMFLYIQIYKEPFSINSMRDDLGSLQQIGASARKREKGDKK